MNMNLNDIEQKAKRAYELGRVRASLPFALLIVPLIFLSAYLCEREALACAIGFGLILVCLFFLWRGQHLGRAVVPGFVVGLFMFGAPTLLHALGLCCRNNIETVVCASSGLIAGGFLAYRTAAAKAKISYLFASAFVALLTGTLGCAALGASAIGGLVGGFALAALPTFLLARSTH